MRGRRKRSRRYWLNEATALCALTHDPKIDVPALAAALDSPAFYIGSLGRYTTQLSRYRQLVCEGYDDAALSRVFGPIGLDLKGRAPAEIALSIMAEITAVRYGGRVPPVHDAGFRAPRGSGARRCVGAPQPRRLRRLRLRGCGALAALGCALVGCSGGSAGDAGSEDGGDGASADAVQVLTASEAHDLMTSDRVVILDVRTQEEYDAAHIVNARLLPLDDIDEDAAAAVAPDKDALALVYCRTGVRSGRGGGEAGGARLHAGARLRRHPVVALRHHRRAGGGRGHRGQRRAARRREGGVRQDEARPRD